MESASRQVVVVLGSGRSGTSLLMQVLVKMGMQVSEHLIPANASNPEGFFEDAELTDRHAELIANLGSFGNLPLPDDWLTQQAAKTAVTELKQLLEARLSRTQAAVFGMKDPRISMLLPLWLRIFNRLRVVPRFVLSVRAPHHVVASMVRQYDVQWEVAELGWLTRTLESLEQTAADCFIAHYERWFTDTDAFAEGLLSFTGLDRTLTDDRSAMLSQVIKPNLNHAKPDAGAIQNPFVKKLYAALQDCQGADFDRDTLLAVVAECRAAMDGFKGWRLLADQAHRQHLAAKKQAQQANLKLKELQALQDRVFFLEKEKARSDYLSKQLDMLQESLEQLTTVEPS